MPTRSFTDRDGITWQVWQTVPGNASLVARELAGGWLTFASAEARRRLSPVPIGWEKATDERLDLMCRAAQPV